MPIDMPIEGMSVSATQLPTYLLLFAGSWDLALLSPSYIFHGNEYRLFIDSELSVNTSVAGCQLQQLHPHSYR